MSETDDLVEQLRARIRKEVMAEVLDELRGADPVAQALDDLRKEVAALREAKEAPHITITIPEVPAVPYIPYVPYISPALPYWPHQPYNPWGTWMTCKTDIGDVGIGDLPGTQTAAISLNPAPRILTAGRRCPIV